MAGNGAVQKKIPEQSAHEIILVARRQMKITGVKDIVGFDLSYVEMDTLCGRLYIDGENIKIGTLDTERGIVELEGRVDSFTYSDGEPSSKKGLFKRVR